MSSKPQRKKKNEKTLPIVQELEQKVKSYMKADVEEFYQQFIKGPMTYEHFVQCYKDSDFWMICFGRLSVADEYEFTEDYLHYAMSLVFPVEMRGKRDKPKRVLNENVELDHEKAEQLFGIFLTYTGFFTQPQSEVRLIKLRIELAEYLPYIMEQLVVENQYHALYCLQRLIAAKAFVIVPFDEDHNPLLQRTYNTYQEKPDLDEIIDFDRLESVTNCQDVKILSELHTKYEELKKKCGLPKSVIQQGQNISNIFNEITTEAYEKFNQSLEPPPPPRQEESIIHRVSTLRNKAMTSDITVPRHRRHKFGFGIDDEGTTFEQRDDEEDDEEESSGRKKGKKKAADPVQIRAKATVTQAHNKAERVRRETEGTNIPPDELLRKEVEIDMAKALEKSSRRSPRKKRTSTTTSDATITPSQSIDDVPGPSTRRRSTRLSRKSVEDVTLPPVEMAKTQITKAALKVLEQSQDVDFELRKLRSMKK